MKLINKSALVAMSGGVDSSVALYFSKKKYEKNIGVTLKLFSNDDISLSKDKACCSISDVYDAKKVAGLLGCPHYTLDYKEKFNSCVIDKFIKEYENGRTPNPCIDCNKYIKYKYLLDDLEKFNSDILVTGHYAKIVYKNNKYELHKAEDDSKDQSYFLYMLNQKSLRKIDFPLGQYNKTEIRKIADDIGLINSKKRDSQDICFVKDKDYFSFIKNRTNKDYKKGKFLDTKGNFLGENESIIKYTIGQRKGIGISSEKPLYVLKKNFKDNSVIVGSKNELLIDTFNVNNLSFVSDEKLLENKDYKTEVKVRYNQKPLNAKYFLEGNHLKVVLKEKILGIASGQALVIYEGSKVIGGGTIM